MEGDTDVEKEIKAALESASTAGMSPLMGEANKLLSTRDRVGPNTTDGNPLRQVLFGFPRLATGVTVTPMWISEAEWVVYDFVGKIHQLKNDPIFNHYGKTLAGKNKRLIIHLAASLVALKRNKMTATGALEIDQLEVSKLASDIARGQYTGFRMC